MQATIQNSNFTWDEDCRFYLRNHTTRVANLILKRINEVPFDEGDPEFNKRALAKLILMRAMLVMGRCLSIWWYANRKRGD